MYALSCRPVLSTATSGSVVTAPVPAGAATDVIRVATTGGATGSVTSFVVTH